MVKSWPLIPLCRLNPGKEQRSPVHSISSTHPCSTTSVSFLPALLQTREICCMSSYSSLSSVSTHLYILVLSKKFLNLVSPQQLDLSFKKCSSNHFIP